MIKSGILGHNIGYSLSKAIHRLIYAYAGVSADYKIFDVPPENFGEALPELFALDAFNVTKPYKRRIIDFLDGVDGDYDAVNLVVNKGGKKTGYNTDYYGFKEHFLRLIDPDGHRVLVLGAGGAAEVIVPFLISRNANVFVYNRTPKAANKLCDKYGASYVAEKDGKYEIIVNCSSFGLKNGENAAEGLDFSETFLAYDLIYFKTEFLKAAAEKGVPFCENGMDMLILQAMRADEIVFGIKIDDKPQLLEKIKLELAANKKEKGV